MLDKQICFIYLIKEAICPKINIMINQGMSQIKNSLILDFIFGLIDFCSLKIT
jgi:Fe-S-cluster containining protein